MDTPGILMGQNPLGDYNILLEGITGSLISSSFINLWEKPPGYYPFQYGQSSWR